MVSTRCARSASRASGDFFRVLYRIRHLTTYAYEEPVSYARCTLRLTPRDVDGQKVVVSRIAITPQPTKVAEATNFFGTQVTSITIETPHSAFAIEASSEVDLTRPFPRAEATPAWEDARGEALALDALDGASPAHYLYPSRLVEVAAPLTAYARTFFPAGRAILDGAGDLMRQIKQDFAYEPKSTAVSTPLLEAFEKRRGVCQDFAHIMIACLRGIGLPAAYVSGYIRTISPPGKPRLEGADATHAWVSVWCGEGAGWIDLDPTNNMRVGNDHIALAVGRDYGDVSPIDGVIVGSGKQELKVSVDVVPQSAGATV
jgi:transglutaminase-like putative cysteine protease